MPAKCSCGKSQTTARKSLSRPTTMCISEGAFICSFLLGTEGFNIEFGTAQYLICSCFFFFFFFFCPGGCNLKRGKVLGGKSILPWPGEQTLSIWLTWYIPGWKKEEKTKPGELQMDLVSTKTSTPKDSDGENAVKPI